MINKKLIVVFSVIVVVASGFVVLYDNTNAHAQLNGSDAYDDLTYSGEIGYSLALSWPSDPHAYDEIVSCLKRAQYKHDLRSNAIEKYAEYRSIEPSEVTSTYRTSVQIWVAANSASPQIMYADVEKCLTGYTRLLE